MAFHDFVKLERILPDGLEIYLIHKKKPPFTVQIMPRVGKDGKVQGGVIKRICIENSPTGDYCRYSKLIAEAEQLFESFLCNPGTSGRSMEF